jgi:Flp pilus assembly protein TadD
MRHIFKGLLIISCLINCPFIQAYPPSGPLMDGANAWVQGDLTAARNAFIKATKNSNTAVNAWYNLGYLYLWEGQLDSAVQLMNQALDLNPDFTPALFELGKIAFNKGDITSAKQHLEQAVSIPYASFRVWYLLGESQLRLGDTIGARDAFAQSLKDHPGYHLPLESLAKLSLLTSDTLTALEILEENCFTSPSPSGFRQYINLLQHLGKIEKADSISKKYHYWFPDSTISNVNVSHLTDNLSPFFPVSESQRFHFSWEFIKLGSAELSIVEQDTLDSMPVLKVTAEVRSNPLIFLVNVQDDYQAWIDPITAICHQFRFHMNSPGVDMIGIWDYQYQKHQYISRTVVGDGYIFGITQPLPIEATDGLSLIYHLRYRVKENLNTPFLFVLDDEYHTGELHPGTATKTIMVGNQKWQGFSWQGLMNCRGIVGLSGNFQAWFSKIPKPYLLKAEAKIFLGSVKITLEELSP